MNLVDSVGWIEFFSGGPAADRYFEYLINPNDVVTPSIVVYEVYKKLLLNTDRRSAAVALAQIGKTAVVEISGEIATSAAELGIQHKLPMVDAIVFATAISTNALLITSDKHFIGLPSVIFIDKYGLNS